MYKVGIADNKLDNIERLKDTIGENVKRLEIVGIVSSGTELVTMVKEQQPDILFINVCLKEINGIEALRQIREENSCVHVIVISPYNSIELVREAISLRVDDYILEPLHKGCMLDVLDKTVELVHQERKQYVGLQQKERIMGEVYEYVDYSFVYALLFGGLNEEDIIKYKTLLNLGESGYILNIEFPLEGDMESVGKEGVQQIYSCIKGVVSRYFTCVVGPKVLNRVVVFVSLEDELDGGYQKSVDLAREIKGELAIRKDILVKIGIGGMKDIEYIYSSYEEALRCLSYEGDGIIQVKELEDKPVELSEYSKIEMKMLESIKFGKEEALNFFSSILDMLRPLNGEARRNKILEMLILASHEVRVNDEGQDRNINYTRYFEEAFALSDEEINRWAYQKFEYIIKTVRVNRTTKKSSSVSTAIRYMERHYRESISLDEIAKYIGVSPQHFSKIFKDETGINYVDWLANLRISRAKKLLNEGEKTIKEICFLVGYNDPNYFSRIFKKVVGISPVKYSREGTPQESI